MYKEFDENNVSEALRRIIGLPPKAVDDNRILIEDLNKRILVKK